MGRSKRRFQESVCGKFYVWVVDICIFRLELDENNKQVLYAQKRLRVKIKKQQEKEKKIFGGMFGKINLVDENETKASTPTEEKKESEEMDVDSKQED